MAMNVSMMEMVGEKRAEALAYTVRLATTARLSRAVQRLQNLEQELRIESKDVQAAWDAVLEAAFLAEFRGAEAREYSERFDGYHPSAAQAHRRAVARVGPPPAHEELATVRTALAAAVRKDYEHYARYAR